MMNHLSLSSGNLFPLFPVLAIVSLFLMIGSLAAEKDFKKNFFVRFSSFIMVIAGILAIAMLHDTGLVILVSKVIMTTAGLIAIIIQNEKKYPTETHEIVITEEDNIRYIARVPKDRAHERGRTVIPSDLLNVREERGTDVLNTPQRKQEAVPA